MTLSCSCAKIAARQALSLGGSREATLPKHILSAVTSTRDSPERAQAFARLGALRQQAHAGDQQSIRYRLRCKNGDFRWVETRSRARTTSRGVEQIICITRDVHDEHLALQNSRAASLVMAEQERVTIMGGIVAALSHELNNPLQAVMGVLEVLVGAPGETGALGIARQATLRMRQVIREMSSVLQGDWTEHTVVDLAAASERVSSLLPQDRPCRVVAQLEPAPILGVEAVLMQCLYHIAFSHIEGTPEEVPEVVLNISIHRHESEVEFQLVSNATQLPTRVRADLTSIRQGRGAQWAVPMQLATLLAEQMRGRIDNAAGPPRDDHSSRATWCRHARRALGRTVTVVSRDRGASALPPRSRRDPSLN